MEEKKALSTQEVADILQVSKSTIYDLIKKGKITSYKIGRKVRFTESDVQKFIAVSKKEQSQVGCSASGIVQLQPCFRPQLENCGFVICGQDLILDILSNYMRNYGITALRAYTGSYDSLIALYKGQVDVASAHLWDSEKDQYNVSYVKALLPGIPAVVVRFISRQQGLYVRKGNPKGLSSWEDFRRSDITMINREYGAGSRVLLDENLQRMGLCGKYVAGYQNMVQSHLAVASAVGRGDADIGVGTEKMAEQVESVDFIPLKKERYDLVVRKEDMDRPEMVTLLEIIRSEPFHKEFGSIGGYDITDMGEIIYGI
jgi:putative molybdopterin biosynthesis protein